MVDIVFDGKVTSGSLDVNSSTVINGIIDDDTLVTASATTVSTSESLKAYMDINTGYLESELFLLGGM